MPCAICLTWIPESSIVYTIGNGELLTLGGEHNCEYTYLEVLHLSALLGVREERLEIREFVVHVRPEEIRWRMCEMDPPPPYIKCVHRRGEMTGKAY